MKKIVFRHPFLTISLILLFMYGLGQYLGAHALEYFFLQEQMAELAPQLSHIASDLESGSDKPTQRKSFIIKAYDLNDNEIDSIEKNCDLLMNFSDVDIKRGLEPFFAPVLAGGEVAEIRKISGVPSKSIIVGRPLVQDGQVIGSLFLMKPASDFASALDGFYLVYLLSSLVGSLIILLVMVLYIREARVLEQTRKDYIANISHELRNPITTISGLSETLCDEMVNDADKKRQYYHTIYRESRRLGTLIADMLELSGLQSGKTVFEQKVFSGAVMINELENKFTALAEDMGINFEVTPAARKIPDLYSNESRIIQVINILMDNAFKFCGDEGYVKLDAQVKDKWIAIVIENSGAVINEDEIPFVFDRFYRSETVWDKKGSGLGLAIAQELVKNLEERIWVTSESSQGTRFAFTVKKADDRFFSNLRHI